LLKRRRLFLVPRSHATPASTSTDTATKCGAEPADQAAFAINLASEFITTALFATVVTSMTSARAAGRTLRIVGDAAAYLPPAPSLFLGAEHDASRLFFSTRLTGDLSRLYKHLALAMTMTPASSDVWSAPTPHASSSWKDLTDVWQPLCSQMRLLLLVLLELDLLGSSEQLPRLLEVESLTKAARYGGTPCIRSDGQVIIPSWLDKRRDRRIPVGVSVMIAGPSGRLRATLNDMSPAGLGLGACPSFPVGTVISVELPNGRTLAGAVAWTHGGHVGLRLDTPLLETDPIFRTLVALRRAANVNALW
jgi:hypothetical protein